MDTRSDFRRYIDDNKALPPDTVLGHIAWFTVSENPYDAHKMEAEFSRLSLNPAFLPNAINPADAYEKASMEVNKERYAVHGDATAEILVREVVRTDNQIIRKLMREVKDSKNRVLLYTEVGELVFYRPAVKGGVVDHSSATIRATLDPQVSPSEAGVLQPLLAKFQAAYVRYRDFHDGQRVRGVIRNYLLYLNAIQMKPSVYFVHANRSDELGRLAEFVNGLSDQTSMAMLPLPDLPSLRVEVTDAFQREAEKELSVVVGNITKLLQTRKGDIKMTAYLKLKDDYDAVIAKASEYSRTLQISQDRTGAAAELALDALTSLQQKVVDQLGGAT